MAKLGKEQVMVAGQMVKKSVSNRQVAWQLEVTEEAVRYRLRRPAEGETAAGGRTLQPTAVDGYEAAIEGLLELLDCWRVTGKVSTARRLSSACRSLPFRMSLRCTS